jgi:FkbM family methyltransferase
MISLFFSAVLPLHQVFYDFIDSNLNVEQKTFVHKQIESLNFDLNNYKKTFVHNQGFYYIDDCYLNRQKFDGIKSYLAKGLAWEPEIKNLICKFVKKGSIALDIGSHIGTHAVSMGHAVGPSGMVIAFEPQRKLFFELVNNIFINNLSSNVCCLPLAVGDSEFYSFTPEPAFENEGGTGLASHGDECLVINLDSLNLNNISFIKLDVEGFEDQALEGAKQTILRCKPVMVIEILGGVDDKHATVLQKNQRKATINKIEGMGYKVRQISVHDFLAMPNM